MCSASLFGQDIIDQINFDNTDNTDITIAALPPGDCDAVAGTFGVENGGFVISEAEGLACCPCFPGGDNDCGANNNFASITGIQPVIQFCNISIEAVVTLSGSLECGSPVNSCGLDGGDAMRIDVLLGGQRFELGSYCGTQQTGTFRLDNLSASDMDLIAFEIQGGTQDSDEAYVIESITITGFPVPLVPVDIMVPPNTPDTLCSGMDPLFLIASGAANDQYIWTLENDMGVNTLPETGATITRGLATEADAGIYRATVNDPSNPCNNSVAVQRVIVVDCSGPVPDFSGSLQTIFCRDTDILSYPNVSNNDIRGTWNFSDNLVLADTSVFSQVIFTPDPSTGAQQFVQDIRLDMIPILGSFPLSNTLELCIFNDPVQEIDFATELGIVSNEILNINFNGSNFFLASDIENFDVSSITPGTYPMNFEFGPFGACGIVDTTIMISIDKLDRVDDMTVELCENEIGILDFTQLLPNSANPNGTWVSVDNSGLDISNPSLVDASMLTAGVYRFQYNVRCGSSIMDEALLTLDVAQRPSRTISPPDLCEGAGFSISFPSGNVYDETIPFGMESVPNPAGDCDSIITIDLQFIPTPRRLIDPPDLCSGDTVSFFGVEYTRTDQIEVPVANPAGICDSLITLNLIFRTQPVDTRTITNGLCEGVPFVFEGVSYNRDTVVNIETSNPNPNECDSLLIVFLDFQTGPMRTIAPTNLCVGSNFIYNNVTYTRDTLLDVTVPNPIGCDSLITLDLTFNPQPTGMRTPAGLCLGMPFIVDGVSYDRDTIFDITVTSTDPNICDSIITVDLQFETGPTRMIAPMDLCVGSTFSFEGVDYTNDTLAIIPVNNPTGCDSLITLDLTFMSQPTGTRTISNLCEGDTIELFGTRYFENIVDDIQVMNPNGCDSLITIDLTFLPTITTTISPDLCEGELFSVSYNGTTYDESNPSGIEMVAAPNGCDSMIIIDLVFKPNVENLITHNGMVGDGFEVVVDGVTYNEDNPSDIVFLSASNGCDSVVIVDLIFIDASSALDSLVMSACSGDGFSVPGKDGIIYDEDNPTGIDTFLTADGRDSFFITRLTFLEPGINSVSSNQSSGDGFSVTLNGVTYDESNPMGRDTIVGGAANMCDSIIIVDLIFRNTAAAFDSLIMSACSGDGFAVPGIDGIIYDEDNPTGIDTFLTADGRDSFFITRLTFLEPGINSVSSTQVLGDGFSVTLNGITYDESNPTGRDTIVGGAANMCDSIIIVNIEFGNALRSALDTTLCMGDGFSRMVGNSIYDESNPIGIDTFTTAAGLDSFVFTNLMYEGPGTFIFMANRCIGDGFNYPEGTTSFNEARPTGDTTIVGGAANGCDSIITVILTFRDEITTDNIDVICPGTTVTVGNSVYSEMTTLSGVDTFMTSAGCDSIVRTELTVDSILIEYNVSDVCVGTDMTTVQIINLQPSLPLNVFLGGQDFSLNDTVELPINLDQQNDLIVSNQNGCSITPTIEFMDAEAFTLELLDDNIAGDSLQLSFAFDGVISSTIWSSADGGACIDCDAINVSNNQQNTYTISITDELGCIYEASIDIQGDGTTIPTPDPATFYVSNTFSRSGATGNDRLYLSTADQDIISYDLTVFDRWGNVMYNQVGLTPNESQMGWNGMGPDNVEVRTGVYIYKIELVRTTGTIEIAAGDVLFLN